MLATTTANISLAVTSDRNGKTTAALRSEPARPIAVIADQGSTTSEKYKDKVTLSADGLEKSPREESPGSGDTATAAATGSGGKEGAEGPQPARGEHTEADRDMIRQLKERDLEVRAHEMAHLANAGQYARGGPTYSYQQGPDGRRYAVGGEVPIDLGKEQTPAQTLQKMQAVKRAALAPAQPSAADRSIAATAAALESQARREQRSEQANPAPETPSGNHAETKDNGVQASSEKEDSAARRRLADNVFA